MEVFVILFYIVMGLIVGVICAKREAECFLGEPAVIGTAAFLFWPIALIGLFFSWISEDW